MKKKLLIIFTTAVCFLSGCANYVKDGTELLEQGEYKEAVEEFEKAVEKEKDVAEAYRGMGMAYYELREYDMALEHLQSALDQGAEETPVIYNLLGVCYMNQGDYSGALAAYQKGCELPESVSAGDSDDGTNYSEVVQEMKYNQIVCYEKLLDWEGAKAAAESYVSTYPEDTQVQKEAEFLRTR